MEASKLKLNADKTILIIDKKINENDSRLLSNNIKTALSMNYIS